MDYTLLEPKVLVLDSDQGFLSQCQNELQKHGMTLVAGKLGAAATISSQIAQHKPDVIITDLYIGKMDSTQFIQETRRQAGDNDPHFIVLSSYNDRNLFQECCEAGAAYCMIKPIDFTILSERIGRVCDRPKTQHPAYADTPTSVPIQNDLEAQVTNILHRFGVPAHIKGYTFLRYAILTAIEDSEMLELVTKILYPPVARNFGTTASRVERAMRHAIEVAWDRGDIEVQNEIFGYTVKSNRGKPTNSEFIALIVDRLRLQNRSSVHRMEVSHI